MSHQWILLRGLAREKQHSEAFLEQLKKASPDSEVISLDFPGAGDYFRLSSPMSITGIAEFVHSHFPKHRAEKRTLVAISLGGMVAVEIARLYPKSIDDLVLINSSFKNLNQMFERLQPEALLHILKAGAATTTEAREDAVLKMVSNNPQRGLMVSKWSEIARLRPVSVGNFAKQLFAAATYNLPETKPDIPIYVFTSEGDRMVSPKCSKKLAEHWQLPIAIHPSAGHELYLDAPDWVIEKLQLYCGK